MTNTGALTLHDVSITGVNFSGSGGLPTIVCPTGALPPGESVVCTATYVTTEADAADGRIDLTASATATGPDGASVVAPEDAVEVTLPPDREPPVTPPTQPGASGLPPTGIDVAGPITAAVLLLTLGTALLMSRRRAQD